MLGQKKLFCPGPVMTSNRVKQAIAPPDMCHRRPVFEQFVANVRQKILRLMKADDQYTAVVISGSGTSANEAALSSLVKDSDEVLLIKNGTFGERLDDILSCYHYKLHKLEYEWGQLPDVADIEAALVQNENIQWICMVYHETSTGLINPVKEVGLLASRYGRKFFTDCVSSAGGEDIDVLRDHIDACTSSSNKCIACLPGASFVCVRRSCVPKLGLEVPRRNIYLNLQKHIDWADLANQTPNTPAVPLFVALDAALDELFEEGLENRIKRHRLCSSILREGLRGLGLEIFLPDHLLSNTVTPVLLPKALDLAEFIDELDRRGFVVYPGKDRLLNLNLFYVANMGWIHPDDCTEFLRTLEETLGEMLAGRIGRGAVMQPTIL